MSSSAHSKPVITKLRFSVTAGPMGHRYSANRLFAPVVILSPPQRIGALTIPYEVPILVWSERKFKHNRIEPQQKQRTYSALIR